MFPRVKITISLLTLLSLSGMELALHLSMKTQLPSIFKFGIIADVQYCDEDDAMNFQGTSMRRYRNSLNIFESAIQSWNSLPTAESIACAVCLGDQLDGKTAMSKTQDVCVSDFLKAAALSKAPIYYCYGNHEYYSFDRQNLYNHFTPHADASRLPQTLGGLCTPNRLYYDWQPFPRWRFIVLDSYDISIIGSSSDENLGRAKEILRKNNPNDVTISGGWFKDLPRERYRYVPYNGGISPVQLNWLRKILVKSSELEEKVVFFCHQPIYSPNKPQSLVWNSEEVLDLIHQFENTYMWIAGHDHGGQYAVDDFGIHHIVPPAPLECGVDETAFGHIEVHEDKFVLNWSGKGPDRSVLPWPKTMNFRS